MPLYEFMNRETGESVGELFLSLDGREDFLRQNPKLCVKPGKLRMMAHKSAESFPSYPDIDNHTRTKEERVDGFVPPEPASWVDTDEDTGKKGIKIVDKRVNKISHFDEDLKKYGKIVGTPTFTEREVDSNEPITHTEAIEQQIQDEKDNPQQAKEAKMGMRGMTGADPIVLSDTQDLMPWEKGFAAANKDRYNDSKSADRSRRQEDHFRERTILGLEDPDED